MNLDAMKELLAAVEAGAMSELPYYITVDAVPRNKSGGPSRRNITWIENAYLGDMNAALALHGALLPRWDWSLATSLQGKCRAWTNTVHGLREPGHKGSALTPARALLIATLRGKIAEMEGEPT